MNSSGDSSLNGGTSSSLDIIAESSVENSYHTSEEEESMTFKPNKQRKKIMLIETDESESEVSHAIVENESADDNDAEVSYESIESYKSVNSSDEENKPTIESEESESEQQKTAQVRGSLWLDSDVLSSTKIHRHSELLENPIKTPTKHSKANLRELFLTPREVKNNQISSDDSEDDSNSKNTFAAFKQNSSFTKSKVHNSDIIEVSSSDEDEPIKPKKNQTVRQTTLDVFAKPFEPPAKNYVTQYQYDLQKQKISRLRDDFSKSNNLLRTINIAALPDKGKLLKERHINLQKDLKTETLALEKMIVQPAEHTNGLAKEKILSSWEDMQKATELVQPRTHGDRAMATLNAQKALTMELLSNLHSSLKTCPDENTHADDPKGLKVELMPHQKRALAWLMFRETQKPAGGILADDMGLGKTLTMISLTLKQREQDESDDEENDAPDERSGKHKGGTLVVCPASLLNQWEGEVASKTKRGLLDVELYHGPKRERKAKKLAAHDLVITTYSIVQNECEKNGTIFGVKWRRIILDEAHQIRNHKSRTAVAVCRLSAKTRWALTGTPVHNKEEDMYGLLKFLRCTPFDDLAVWRRWIANKNSGGQNRLSAVISSLLLRRTKADLQAAGALKCLPERKWELITVTLDKQEMDVYHKVLVFSRTLFAQFLHQRAEKNQDQLSPISFSSANSNPEYFKMHQKLMKLNRVKEIKQHHILVLLLRLRQICCHPCLITSMLDNENLDGDDEDSEQSEELNILEQLKKLELDDDTYDPAQALSEEPVGLAEASRGILNPSHPVFSTERQSSKMKVIMQVLKEKVLSVGDKAIIVSQWTSLLQLIAQHLKNDGIQFNELNGTIPVHKRMGLVDDFNNPKHPVQVMLLSLTAGGVGLNLVGGNHLFLVDLHWNPQLEMQAQDRIYRVGQRKDVNVYKFMTVETIEERIKRLQESKLEIANSMLTGSKIQSSKLTLSDLKMLFNM